MSPLPHLDPQALDLSGAQPRLLVVVDTEEEFNWSQPFNRQSISTRTIPAQDRAHAIYDRLGVVPTYVINYPVAVAAEAARYLRRLVEAGRADFGTHCHPWVTPPYTETVSDRNSFHGNLPAELEAAKIRASTEAVAQAMGRAPRIFKAGRYGVGPNTFQVLHELGYSVDCSFVPHTRFTDLQGPDFRGTPEQPFFTDATRRLLEVPLTVGYTGPLQRVARSFPHLLDGALLQALRVPGVLSRLGLMSRIALSPEGYDTATLCRLLRAMVGQGARVFTMCYHSPSMVPGHTPYVADEASLQAFLKCIETVLTYFRDELGGSYSTLSEVERQARSTMTSAGR